MVIQRWYRWQKAGQAQRADYVRVKKAALTLQAVWRGVLARRNARVCWMGGRKEERECREEGWRRLRGQEWERRRSREGRKASVYTC